MILVPEMLESMMMIMMILPLPILSTFLKKSIPLTGPL